MINHDLKGRYHRTADQRIPVALAANRGQRYHACMRNADPDHFVGIDTGGTFTDFIHVGPSGIASCKILSSPEAPEKAIFRGLKALGLEASLGSGDVSIVHGTTVATNAALEHKGAKTAFITNQGFGDLLELGRQNRASLYELNPRVNRLGSDKVYRLEIDTRRDASGELIQALTPASIEALTREIAALKPEAIAICLLFAFKNNQEERALREALSHITDTITISSELHPEPGEYERAVITVLNSYLAPPVRGYLSRLVTGTTPSEVKIMQSSGLTISADKAAARAAHLLLSGPAGGLIGANQCFPDSNLMTFDMGGTSTDVALIEGSITPATSADLDGLPLAMPALDLTTIGAGGGSIAWINEGGLLSLGPASAGASPGPACYQQGGSKPTVTDAHAVLGHFEGAETLSDDIQLSSEAAARAIQPLAEALGMPLNDTANGIIDLANEKMAQALRVISIQRGFNPAEFTLTCFGGAGGLHLCSLAQSLGMRRAVVPAFTAMFSALGMLMARPGRVFTRAIYLPFAEIKDTTLSSAIQSLIDEADSHADLANRGPRTDELAADVRYAGQSTTLEIPLSGDLREMRAQFERAHETRYGHKLMQEPELVRIRWRAEDRHPLPRSVASLQQPDLAASFQRLMASPPANLESLPAILSVKDLHPYQHIEGPRTLLAPGTTIRLDKDWIAMRDEAGHLLLMRDH